MLGGRFAMERKEAQGFVEVEVAKLKIKPVIFFRSELEKSFNDGTSIMTIFGDDPACYTGIKGIEELREKHTQTVIINEDNIHDCIFNMIADGLKARLKDFFIIAWAGEKSIALERCKVVLQDTFFEYNVGVLIPWGNTIIFNGAFKLGDYYNFDVLYNGMKFTADSFAETVGSALMHYLNKFVDELTVEIEKNVKSKK